MANPFLALAEEEQDQFVDLVYDRFAGRLDTYAIRVEFPDKAVYFPSTYDGESEAAERAVRKIVKQIGTPEFTPEVVRQHLAGKHLIGLYPIQPDSTVRWFALDFDKKKDTDPDPFAAALKQAKVFWEEAGLPVYIERSQGGKGFHVWGFLDGSVNAGKLRHALAPYIENADTYDRMFPNQNGVSETRPLGNLIAMPFHGARMEHGNSAFVTRNGKGEPVAVEDQFAFLREVELIPVARIDELFDEAGEYQPEREHTIYEGEAEGLKKSWKMTHPVFGCEFVRWCWENPAEVNEPLWYALACNFAQLEDGRKLFHEWSKRDADRYNAHHTDKKYDQAVRANKPHSCEVIRGLGGNCECDHRFPGKVYHPFDMVKLSFKAIVESIGVEDGDDIIWTAAEGFDAAIEWAEQVEKDPSMGQGNRYGIKSLDAATGLRPSDLVIAAARPGMGKTAFAGTVMNNLALAGVPTAIFSMEMSKLQFFKRGISTIAGVSQTRITTGQLTGEDWKKIRAAQKLVSDPTKYPLYVDDLSRSTDRIFEIAADLVYNKGVQVIFIDYLQLAQRLPRESIFDAVTRFTHDFKLMAKALNVCVVCLTQLNRTADDATSDSQTYDSWLRGSGDIEQAADVIIFLLGEKGPGVKERIAALHKERHREGGLRIDLEFNQPLMQFGEQGTWQITQPGPDIKRREDAPTVEGKKGKRRIAEEDRLPFDPDDEDGPADVPAPGLVASLLASEDERQGTDRRKVLEGL